MTLGLLVASENANRHTHTDIQDACFISIDIQTAFSISSLKDNAVGCMYTVLLVFLLKGVIASTSIRLIN